MSCIARVVRVCCVDYERKRVARVTRVVYARRSRRLCKGPKGIGPRAYVSLHSIRERRGQLMTCNTPLTPWVAAEYRCFHG
ncbi:unnamed protein product [Arctogadus glacialis]